MISNKNQILLLFIVLYIYVFYRFIGDEFIPAISSLSSFILLAIEAVVIILGISKIPKVNNNYLKIFFALFLCSSSVSYVVNLDDLLLTTHLNGLRSYLVIFSISSFLMWVYTSRFKYKFISYFNKFVDVFLWSQIPTCLYQFIKYGAGDEVGGTMSIGFSGVLTCIVFLLVFYKLVLKASKCGRFNLKELIKVSPLLLPVFINETKITFFLLPLLIFLIIKYDFSSMGKNIGILFISILFFLGFNSIYKSVSQEITHLTYNEIFSEEFFQKYLISDDVTYEEQDISRFARFSLYADLLHENSYSILFGKGFGLFKGSSFLGESNFTKKHKQLLSGSNVSGAMMFLEGGVVNILLISLFFMFLIIDSLNSKIPFYCKRYILYTSALLLVAYVYNQSIFSFVFIFLILNSLIFFANVKKSHEK